MTANHSEDRPNRRTIIFRAAAVLAVGVALTGCGKKSADEQATTPATSETSETAPAAAAPTPSVTALSADQLREAASKAYAENRLYAPAQDNAVEYYLALRDKSPADPAVASALTDLLPMTVIAIEQSVNREDFSEADRLAALLERADAQHPALARLRESIASRQAAAAQRAQQLTAEEEARRQKAVEEQRLADQKKQQEEAAKKLAAQQEKAAAEKAAAERQAAERAAATQRAAAETRAAAQQPAATAAAPSASQLRPISMPAPRYPPDALRAGTSGSVLIEYTVGTDGTVTAARVVRSNPTRVFDREAVNAVRRWRFQPVAEPITTRREISFSPQG